MWRICRIDSVSDSKRSEVKDRPYIYIYREMAIINALAKKNYAEVERLALDGEIQDKGLPGLVKKWREYRYDIHKKTKQLDKQRNLAMEFVLDNSFKHYIELKSTYKKDEWNVLYPEILQNVRKDDRYFSIYTDILIEEKETKRLLEFVKENPAYIKNYYKYILPLYRDEVGELFEKVILEDAKNARDRNRYRDVCSELKLIAKQGYTELAKKLIGEFQELYRRRTAFLDELKKIRIK